MLLSANITCLGHTDFSLILFHDMAILIFSRLFLNSRGSAFVGLNIFWIVLVFPTSIFMRLLLLIKSGCVLLYSSLNLDNLLLGIVLVFYMIFVVILMINLLIIKNLSMMLVLGLFLSTLDIRGLSNNNLVNGATVDGIELVLN